MGAVLVYATSVMTAPSILFRRCGRGGCGGNTSDLVVLHWTREW